MVPLKKILNRMNNNSQYKVTGSMGNTLSRGHQVVCSLERHQDMNLPCTGYLDTIVIF